MKLNFVWLVSAHFFRADFTAMKLRQYDADEFDFHKEGTIVSCFSDGCTTKHLR